MSTPNSNEKSISQFNSDAVNGDGILGGGKSAPVVVAPSFDETPMDVNIPQVIIPVELGADYITDGIVKPIDGGAPLS